MEQEGFVVGVDLGTSNIIGLLGRRNEQGVISILASESIPSDSCIKHGIVYNIDEAAGKVRKLLSLLENKVGRKIGKVYVSLSGMSLRAIEHLQTMNMAIPTDVTFAMLEKMEQEARSGKLPLLNTYSVVSPETYLNGHLEEDPLGKQAATIETRYRLIAGRPNMKSNLYRCITDKNQIEIAGYIIGPVATGAILLGEEEKKSGCALVDFGGGTTTVSIYTNGLLRSLSVIPFGGRTITRDIQSLGFTEEVAESYKKRYGKVGKNRSKQEPQQATATDPSLDLRELNKVIHLRQEEIILNVIHQINESGYADKLKAGVFITGGASQMNGLVEYFEEKSGLNIQTGAIKRLYINNATDLLQDPPYSQSLGIMLFAKENCEKTTAPMPEARSQPEQQQQTASNQTETVNKQEQANQTEKKEKETESKSKPPKEHKKSPTLFDFFGKIQNIGGAMFKDEE